MEKQPFFSFFFLFEQLVPGTSLFNNLLVNSALYQTHSCTNGRRERLKEARQLKIQQTASAEHWRECQLLDLWSGWETHPLCWERGKEDMLLCYIGLSLLFCLITWHPMCRWGLESLREQQLNILQRSCSGPAEQWEFPLEKKWKRGYLPGF